MLGITKAHTVPKIGITVYFFFWTFCYMTRDVSVLWSGPTDLVRRTRTSRSGPEIFGLVRTWSYRTRSQLSPDLVLTNDGPISNPKKSDPILIRSVIYCMYTLHGLYYCILELFFI